MIQPSRTLEQISDGLIAYLRAELDSSVIDYRSPLTQMRGGYETYTYRFQLSGVGQELASPLILRLYPHYFGTGNAIRESAVQNALADKGYPVPRVHFTCTDPSLLGGAFFVMEFLPGELMMTAPFETIPDMLGEAHAALHDIEPEPLVVSLEKRGMGADQYNFQRRLNWLERAASQHPWLRTGVDWVVENRLPEPESPSICHGDFHPLNILVQDGKVTGVLDWPGFLVGDPVLDVATTIVLTTISGKHVLALTDVDKIVQKYLAAYRAQRTLHLANLDYYIVQRCVQALVEGAEGQEVWQQPPIVTDLIETVGRITGIRTTPPGYS